ncbi:hypothetical protein REPUB_Repub15cG0114800 [Reevesia pubescens]
MNNDQCDCPAVDLDESAEVIESLTGGEVVAVPFEGDSIVEPHEGMEFESEDAAKIFYDEYARIRGKFGPVRKLRPSTRKGCKAMIHIKFDKSEKWVIMRFVKDHNHPLVVAPREARQTMDEKDKKIQEVTAELRNKKLLCAAYQERLTAFMKIVEDHSNQLSKKVQNVELEGI